MTSHDPIGPGTPAWAASDECLAAYHRGDTYAYHLAYNRMMHHLTKNHADFDTIEGWKHWLRRSKRETPED